MSLKNPPASEKKFAQMYEALSDIAEYFSTSQLRRSARNSYGLDYEEALEMAYENVRIIAKQGLKGVKLAERAKEIN